MKFTSQLENNYNQTFQTTEMFGYYYTLNCLVNFTEDDNNFSKLATHPILYVYVHTYNV